MAALIVATDAGAAVGDDETVSTGRSTTSEAPTTTEEQTTTERETTTTEEPTTTEAPTTTRRPRRHNRSAAASNYDNGFAPATASNYDNGFAPATASNYDNGSAPATASNSRTSYTATAIIVISSLFGGTKNACVAAAGSKRYEPAVLTAGYSR